jgi:signal transduction histidine kinase
MEKKTSYGQESIDVLQDFQQVTDTLLGVLRNAKKSIEVYADPTWPSIVVSFPPYNEGYIDAKGRGVAIKVVTEITSDNMHYCKEIMKFAELRHIDGIKGNFEITETEYVASATLQKEKPVTQIIYSNAKNVIDQQRFVFRSFWSKAIPAEQRIKEIVEGTVGIETRLIDDPSKMLELFKKQLIDGQDKWWSVCSSVEGLMVAHKSLLEEHKKFLSMNGKKERWLTTFNREYVPLIREFLDMGMQIRHSMHLPPMVFSVSNRTFNATVDRMQGGKLMRYLLISNEPLYIQYYNNLFEELWLNGIDAADHIKEIEEGIEPCFTTVINSQKDIISRARYVTETSNQLSVCSTFDGLKMIESIVYDSIEKILEKSQKGEHKGVRWIGTINKEDIDVVKRFLDLGMEIKHLRYTPLNFSVTNKEFNFTISNMEGGSIAPSVLISNEQPYITQFNFLFEQLWSQGVDAKERINELEAGIEPPRVEIIQNPSLALQTYKNLIQEAKEEILIIFPTANAASRQEKAGIIELLGSKAKRDHSKDNSKNSKLKIRILMPYHPIIGKIVESLKQYPNNIDIRFIEQSTTGTTLATFFVVDRSSSLVMEIKDDSKETFVQGIGLSVFSNSRAGILSTVSIFERLWMQTELYEQVKRANEQLQLHDRMQREFINIAAHELRTPIQPLLVAAEILESELYDKDRIEVTKGDIELIIRNARRLERLSSDVLTVSRIESRSLKLHKETIDLKEKIQNNIADAKSYIKSDQQLEIVIEPISANDNKPVIVEADKSKLFEVLSNLLRNAIKFTEKGTITVSFEKQEEHGCAVVSIRDTGKGIDPDVMPRLFEKFASGSETEGTGLGLFISKAIVEAHGGRIWAENNHDGKGATFTFTLQLGTPQT